MRPMDILINIDVDDVDKAADFYTRALGLKVGRRLENNMTVELTGGSSWIYLLKNNEGTPAVNNEVRTYQRHWTPVHFDFVVEDIHAAVRRAEEAGAKVEHAIKKYPYGYLAVLGDPFGHGFCFIEFTGRGYDEIAQSRN
jgi:predicted enzyme related to lactoylglutathione lyase